MTGVPVPDMENLQLPTLHPKEVIADLSMSSHSTGKFAVVRLPMGQLTLVISAVVVIAATLSHLAAVWMGLPTAKATYRRIGPETGPQAFCAGSSVVQFGLSWPEVSEALDQGIESWGVGGSTPSEWEQFQSLATNTNLMILGLS